MVESSGTQERVDILLVDDRPENLLALEAVLSSPAYRLIKAFSGDQALRYLLDHEPAVILMDVQMPNLDGFETASIIKRSERTREIPIIFITAINQDERYIQKGYDHGAVDYLQKPYEAYALKSKVAVFAELARKSRRLLQAEVQLRESEKRERDRQFAQLELRSLRREQSDQKKYLGLVDGINHGIVWSADPESMRITFVGSSTSRIVGYLESQWLNEKNFWTNHLDAEDRSRFQELLENVLKGSDTAELEHRFLAADGRVVWLQTSVRLDTSGEGTPPELRCLSVDITRLKDTERNLIETKKRSDFLAEASLILAESLNYEQTLSRLGKLAVPALADFCAVHVQNPEGKLLPLSVSHSNPDKLAAAQDFASKFLTDPAARFSAAHVLQSGKSQLYPEINAQLLEQASVPIAGVNFLTEELEVNAAMIAPLTARGRTFGTITFFSSDPNHPYGEDDLLMADDLARRAASAIDNAELYEESQRAIRSRDEFLSIASHELRTPLTPLKIQTQWLLRTLGSGSFAQVNPTTVAKMLTTSDRQLDRLSKLIDELLDVSRITMGQLHLNIETFDLVELIQDVIERFRSELTGARCDLTLQMTSPVVVSLDRLRIEQVVVNLLTNAIKYGPGMPIEISVRESNRTGYVQLRFKDQGIGIDKSDQLRIFDRFERAVPSSNFGGLGLGLFIVSQIVDAHQGTIAVVSEPGLGSLFTVEFPLKAEAALPTGLKSIAQKQDIENLLGHQAQSET